MDEKEKEALKTIESQLLGINGNTVSMRWIGMKQTPTMDEIHNLNKVLGFIIRELQMLRETGKVDMEQLKRSLCEDRYSKADSGRDK